MYNRVFFSAVIAMAASASVSANPIVINHTNCDPSRYSDAVLTQASQMTAFFSHASVGGNLMGGLDLLTQDNASRYPIDSVGVYDYGTGGAKNPPTTITPGTIYEMNRGNPEPAEKVSLFEGYMAQGWGNGCVDLAINKYCYIDDDADFNNYRNSMVALEAAYPNTTFVYMTIPLKTSGGAAGLRRHQFNEQLRQFVLGNNKVLFDIADIEAWGWGDAENTEVYNGQTIQVMLNDSDFTHDGGHLYYGGRKYVAGGLYSLFAEVSLVPEPSSLAMISLVGLGLLRRR